MSSSGQSMEPPLTIPDDEDYVPLDFGKHVEDYVSFDLGKHEKDYVPLDFGKHEEDYIMFPWTLVGMRRSMYP